MSALLDRFFHRHPVFSGEELRVYLQSCGELGDRGKESVLAHQRKMGRVLMVRRGLYAVVRPGAGSYSVDPYLVASKATADAAISHHTALEFHGRAYSLLNRSTYTANRPPGAFQFQSREFRGVKTPIALRRLGREDAGIETRDRSGMDVRVTTLERTLVDTLDRPDVSGSWEEIWRSLESVEYFNLDRVIEFARLLGNATTIAKVGFFLEQHRKELMAEDQHLLLLEEFRPKQPHYMERDRRSSGRLDTRWNLVVPLQIIERSWADVV